MTLNAPFGFTGPYDRDLRQPDAPPCDGLAECVCLYECLFDSHKLDRLDLGPLLTYPEHRDIWRLLKTTRTQCPALAHPDFYCEWLFALKRAYPTQWQNYLDLVLSVGDRQTARAWSDYESDHFSRPYTTYRHDFDWWLARVRAIAEARRLISAASQIAERAWRAPDRTFTSDEALAVLERATPRTSPRLVAPPIWEREDAPRL